MRVKLFSSSSAKWLEEAMNEWLEENEARVVIISIDPVAVANSNGLTYVSKINYTYTDKLFEETEK